MGRQFINGYRPVQTMRNRKKIAGWKPLEVSGTVLNIENTYNDDYGVEIIGNYQQTVTVQGKNLFDLDKVTYNANIIRLPNGIRIKNYYETIIGLFSNWVKPNTKYYIHAEKTYSHPSANATGYIANRNYLGYILFDIADGTFTTGETVNGSLYFYGMSQTQANTADDVTVDFTNLYIGTEPYTTYEPFVPNSPSPDYPSAIQNTGDTGSFDLISTNGIQTSTYTFPYTLRAAPNVADRIVVDNVNKVAKVVRDCGKFNVTGDEQYITVQNVANYYVVNIYYLNLIANSTPDYNKTSQVICTHFKTAPSSSLYTSSNVCLLGYTGGYIQCLRFTLDKIQLDSLTGADLIAKARLWIKNTIASSGNIEFTAPLNTPTEEILDYNTIIQQLKTFYPHTDISTQNAVVEPTLTGKFKVMED